jgi:hypothetical protein
VLIGIVADIHEAIEPLERALAEFRRCAVDQVVNLGDACESAPVGGRASKVIALLRDSRATGVWGNHDFGLCFEVHDRVRQNAAPEVLEYLTTMQPHLELEGCRFSHVEPWLDAYKLEDLWYFDGLPDTPAKANRSFAAVPERRLFTGHLHRWLVMSPEGQVAWDGLQPLTLNPETRYLIVVAPVVEGRCAIYDTAAAQLTPVRCDV